MVRGRYIVLAGSLALLALASTARAMPQRVVEPPEANSCQAEPAQKFIGKPFTAATRRALRRASGAARVRPVPPGMMITMLFQPGRLTVYLDAARKITQISCS